jgi:hypothetical protein
LGGSAYRLWNVWPIFTFVAIWHDIELKLLYWGWAISFLMLPEFIGSFVQRKFIRPWLFRQMDSTYQLVSTATSPESPAERVATRLESFGYAFNVILFASANMVGYCASSASEAYEIVTNALSGKFARGLF